MAAPHTSGSFLVGLIGSGIGPSLSPALHEREAGELGLRYLYRRLDLDDMPTTPVRDVLAAARLSGYDGLNVTHPCKQVVLDHLDRLAPDAAALGAVNTVVLTGGEAIGHNTDSSGFGSNLRRGLPGAALDRVVLLGAGGAGAAVAHALLTLGAGVVRIFDSDHQRSRALADSLCARFGERATAGHLDDEALADALREADGLVHATPTGMAAHPGLPLPAALLDPRLWVADIVYRPLHTELVTTARARGCRVLDGGGMAVFQAAASLRLFTGHDPDTDRMLRHFTELTETSRKADAHVPS